MPAYFLLQILLSWEALALPRIHRTSFVLGAGLFPSAAPWQDRQQCQAHVALLACLHQLQEDQPDAALLQQQLLREEEQLMEAGLARLGRRCVGYCTKCTVGVVSVFTFKYVCSWQQL